jgi:hypothetical protein
MIYNASLHLFGGEFNEERQKHESSRVGCVINVQKDSAMGEKCIHQYYIAIVFNYNVKLFQCRYNMTCHLFLCSMDVMRI